MSYRAGIAFPGQSSEPRLVCDGCGLVRGVTKRNGLPYSWLLDRKKAPGWTVDLSGDMRKDWCAECKPRTPRSMRR